MADFNADGYPDIAVLHFGTLGAAVSIYTGAADGTLQPSIRVFKVPSYSSLVSSADLDVDGKPDLVFAGPDNSLDVAWNDPTTEATPQPPVPTAPVGDSEVPQN